MVSSNDNWTFRVVLTILVLGTSRLGEVRAKCSATSVQSGDIRIAYACVHGNFSTDIEEVPSEAEWIEFTVSRINDLPPDAFARFHDLRRLTFYNCDLKTRSPDAFRGLNRLEWLVLSGTKIYVASAKLFRPLKNLRRLTLDGAGLVYIDPEVFPHLRNLETLSLRDNDLDCLPIEALASLTSLKTIRIDQNPWSCDCRGALVRFFEDRMIEHGSDETDRSSSFAPEAGLSTSRNKRRLTRNNLYECMTLLEYPDLPPSATRTTAMTTSYVKESSSSSRFEWRETRASSLAILDRLPDEIGWIQMFEVRIPAITRYAFFRFGSTLRSIELTNCGIERIERESFAGLHKLERLSMIGNRFSSLGHDWFRDLRRLTDLRIPYNGIERIEDNALTHLVGLQRLDLRGNRLRCLPRHYIRGLVSLKRLEATDNPMSCECRNDLQNYLAQMRIGYEVSSSPSEGIGCELDPDRRPGSTPSPSMERDHRQWTNWNESSSSSSSSTRLVQGDGKIRWSWAYAIHRPGVSIPVRTGITFGTSNEATTTATTTTIRHGGNGSGGCHLVSKHHATEIDAYLCTRASLLDLRDIPESLEIIVYSGSILPTIHNDAFRKFGAYLRRLEFRECAIQNIERRAFYGLRNLESLVIRGNDLDVVRSEWFEEARNLRKLDLSRNGITRISNGVFDRVPYLVELDVSHNRLNCIGIEHLEALRYLRQLEIAENPWTCLCITRLVQLMKERTISCDCNPEALLRRNEGGWGCNDGNLDTGGILHQVPTIGSPIRPFETPTTTTTTMIPPHPPMATSSYPNIVDMPPLAISSGYCHPQTQGHPSSNSDQEATTWYHCANGDISLLLKIPSYVTKIEIVDSYVPHLSAMAFARFENLTDLVLRNCTLRDIDPRAFGALSRLERLTLRDNRFAVVKNGWFSDTRNLVWLDMSDNYLTEIETAAFQQLNRLEYINLEGNAFRCIYTSSFVGLPRLATLEFGRNPLKWRCWQELVQFLEIRAIGYTYHKCPHNGKDLVRSMLKTDEGARVEGTNGGDALIDKRRVRFTFVNTMLFTIGVRLIIL